MVDFKDLHVGDVITYRPSGGGYRVVKIEELDADIKKGFSGFHAVIINSTNPNDKFGNPVWGYTSQVIT